MNDFTDGIATLSHLGVIRAEGEDAAKFLHAQLTQDFALLDSNQARLAAFCTAKGRMLASFIGFKRSSTEVLLVCSRDLLPATLKRLSMFVMRAKLKLSDASEEFLLMGLVGTSAERQLSSSLPVWSKTNVGAVDLIRLYPANGLQRVLFVGKAEAPKPEGPALSLEQWLWTEVCSGVATVTIPITEQFVPQMLNYESLGGVNFKKGCYPGQEVVARSQFRGAIKRRAYLVHCTEPMMTANEIYDVSDESQPCGLVVQAAESPLGGYDAILSVQTQSVNGGVLHLKRVDGPILELLELPYPILEDI
jgi:folate-binding protein YgfZ